MATSYANPGGTGDRTGIISVTSNKTPSLGTFSNWVDGGSAANSTDAFRISTFTPTGSDYLRFDFGHPVVIDEATSYQNNTTGQGVWQWQGSHDASSWTNIGSSFTLGGATTLVHSQLAGNTAPYRYYQLVGVSGSFSGTPYNLEIEFKIMDYELEVTFDDEATFKYRALFAVDPDVVSFTTPGADSFVVPFYDQLVIELRGAGASGAAWVYGAPAGADFGAHGEDSTLEFDAYDLVAGGGKKATYKSGASDGGYVTGKYKGGLGGIATGGHENHDGQAGQAGYAKTKFGGSTGAKGGDSPFGGGEGGLTTVTPYGYGGYIAVGEAGEAPGGGGGGAAIAGQAGPPLLADARWSRSLGAGGAGGLCRLVFDIMDDDAPQPGRTINFVIGEGGAAPAGATVDSTDLDGGAGGNGSAVFTIGLVPPPPEPDGGQGTCEIDGDLLRVGDVLTAVYNSDDPDGGETGFGWQWTLNGAPIAGGTGEQYELQDTDIGGDIGVEITYTDALGHTVTIEADEVGPVLPDPRPLDDLLTGLFCAYGMRLLVSTYTGPLIRLRGGSTTNAGHGFQQAGTPANSGNYWRFDFGSSRLITGARWPQNTTTSTTGNGVFQWQGSHDASSWTNIGSNFVMNPTGSPFEDVGAQLAANATAYRYYQLLGVSGNLPNNLIWEAEFKIDDGGETSRIGAPGGQSFQNPGGEGNRSSMITVTTTYADGNTEAQRLVNGRYPDAERSFWPDYNTGELVDEELLAFYADVSPISANTQFSVIYDQSVNARHLDSRDTSGIMPGAWDNTGVRYTVPNGRFAPQSNGDRRFLRNAMDKPEDALYFLEVIKRDNDRPIRDWNFAYGNAVTFSHPVSTANDWAEDNAVLHGNGLNSGNPRAVTAATFPTSDDDAVVWEGGVNASRVGIRHNGTQQLLTVANTGYANEGGTTTFSWPNTDSNTDRQVRICELVFWERDVGYLDGEALALYRTDAMLAWLDEMPSPSLAVVFEDDAELLASFDAPTEPLSLSVEFNDEAWMSALVTGFDFSFSVEFNDESELAVTLELEDPKPLPLQMVVINTGIM